MRKKSSKEISKAINTMKDQKEIDSFPRIDTDNIDSNQVLAKAYGELDSVVLTGYDKDGNFYFASSMADGAEILWLIESLKRRLLKLTE